MFKDRKDIVEPLFEGGDDGIMHIIDTSSPARLDLSKEKIKPLFGFAE